MDSEQPRISEKEEINDLAGILVFSSRELSPGDGVGVQLCKIVKRGGNLYFLFLYPFKFGDKLPECFRRHLFAFGVCNRQSFHDECNDACVQDARKRGNAFVVAQTRLGGGRIHHAMRWLGQARRAFDMMCERALSRYSHGSLLAEKQMIQDFIAESYIDIETAKMLCMKAAWHMDQHGASRSRVEIAIQSWPCRGCGAA